LFQTVILTGVIGGCLRRALRVIKQESWVV
jgi:hypothetical protein